MMIETLLSSPCALLDWCFSIVLSELKICIMERFADNIYRLD